MALAVVAVSVALPFARTPTRLPQQEAQISSMLSTVRIPAGD
jgi:hypothetical protein